MTIYFQRDYKYVTPLVRNQISFGIFYIQLPIARLYFNAICICNLIVIKSPGFFFSGMLPIVVCSKAMLGDLSQVPGSEESGVGVGSMGCFSLTLAGS